MLCHVAAAHRPTWPTYERQSLFTVGSYAAYLQKLHSEGSWQSAGTHWRNRFLLEGELYRNRQTGTVFRVLGSQGGSVLAWIMVPALLRNSAAVQDCWQPSKEHPIWETLLAWEDYSAMPAKARSPLGTFARGLTPLSLQTVLPRPAGRRPEKIGGRVAPGRPGAP